MRFVRNMFRRESKKEKAPPASQSEGNVLFLGTGTLDTLEEIRKHFNLQSKAETISMAIFLMEQARRAESNGDHIAVIDGYSKEIKTTFTFGAQYTSPRKEAPPEKKTSSTSKFRL